MLTVEEARKKLRGVVVPLTTIFDSDGTLDLEATASNVQWIVDQGARQGNTIFLAAGSGGDFTVMSTQERKQVIKAVVDVSKGRIPVMAGVQSTDIRVTIELCRYCEQIGVDLAQISHAYYYDCHPEDVIAWHQQVANQTNMSLAPYSHWYSGSKYDLPLDLVDRLLDIPTAVAVKWGAPSVASFQQGVIRFRERVAVIENMLQPILGHVLGCRAWISHVPNFSPQHSWMVWELMESGRYEEAQTEYDRFMTPYFDLVGRISAKTAGEGVFVRPGLEAAGLRSGTSRLPSRDEAGTPELRESFHKLLEDARSRAEATVDRAER